MHCNNSIDLSVVAECSVMVFNDVAVFVAKCHFSVSRSIDQCPSANHVS